MSPASGGGARTVANHIVDLLVAEGIREVFSVAGGALTPLIGAVGADDAIDYIGVRHEFAAAQMATAVNHATGRIAVCLGEQGPGTLNLVSGLGSAHNNSLAVLALTVSGPATTAYVGSGALMELDAIAATSSVTKWRSVVRSPGDAVAVVGEALRQARSGRPGPVHVDIPRDIIGALLDDSSALVPSVSDSPVPIDEAVLERAITALLGAERPLVIAGGGARFAGASELLRQVADRLGAVTTSTQMGIGAVSSDGALFAGQGGVIGGPALIRAAREADVVLAVGCRFSSWWWSNGERLTKNATLVQIDTDPDAITRSGSEIIGLVGDARPLLEQLLLRLQKSPLKPPSGWALEMHSDLLIHQERLADLATEVAAPAHPAALASQLADLMSSDDLVVLDGGHTTFWSNDFTPALAPATVFHEPGMGQLGFGVPYANALALLHPDRRVVTITGDGAFGFSIMELDTARRLGLRTITVIHNNALWGIISLAQRHAGFSLGTDLSGTDYAAIANGFGCLGIRVEDLTDLPAAYEKALASDLPVVLDVVVRFEPHPMMPDFGRTTAPPPPASTT